MSYNLGMSQKLYDEIKKFKETDSSINTATKPEEEERTWLLFKTGESVLAVESILVKEIIRNNQIFPLPFVPAYIKGLINCYGQPHAIIDLELLYNGKDQSAKLYMVLNDENNIALQITDIIEFQNLPESAFTEFSNKESEFILGKISFEGEEIPVIDIKTITAKIRTEIEEK